MRGAWLPSADASAARDGAMGAAGRLGAPRSRHHRVTPALGKGKVGADGRVPPSRERERKGTRGLCWDDSLCLRKG
jgi:hypothetical protein